MKRFQSCVAWLLVASMTLLTIAVPQVIAIPIGDDPGDIPGIDCLANTTLNSFSASPSTINAGGTSTLSWNVSTPSGCSVYIRLNGQTVSKIGSMNVQPAFNTTYTLRAHYLTGTRTLGSRTVTVQGVQCEMVQVPASLLISGIRDVVDAFTADTPEVYKDGTPQISLSTSGIDLGLDFKVNINNFFDPELDVDARIRLQVSNGDIVPVYSFFDVDVNWPWYVNVLFWVTLVVEYVAEELVEGDLAEMILDEVQAYIDGQIALVEDLIRAQNGLSDSDPLTLNITGVSMNSSSVNVSACFSF